MTLKGTVETYVHAFSPIPVLSLSFLHPFKKKILFLCIECVSIHNISVYCMYAALRGQKKALDPLGLDLSVMRCQVSAGNPTRVL